MKRRGSALLLATIVAILIVGLCTAWLTIATSSARATERRILATHALYAAEAGIAVALNAKASVRGATGMGTYDVQVVRDGDRVTLVSAGTAGAESRRVTVDVSPNWTAASWKME